MEIIIAPVKSPRKPEDINPPITPRKITSIGTEAPFPKNIAFSGVSDRAAPIK
jgi:hypothetical protein